MKHDKLNGRGFQEQKPLAGMRNKPTDEAIKLRAASKDRLLEELMHIALLDPLDFCNPDGTMKPLDEIPEGARRAIGGVNIKQIFEGQGLIKVQTGWLKELKVSSKLEAIKLIGKWCGYETPEKIEQVITSRRALTNPIDIEDRIAMLTGGHAKVKIIDAEFADALQ